MHYLNDWNTWRTERLSGGLYSVQSGTWLHNPGSTAHRVTAEWLGPMDDFGGVASLSDAALAALDVAFSITDEA